MVQRLTKWFVDFWIVMAFGVAAALVVPQAHSAMIGTDSAQATARVDALGDGEVLQLAGKLDAAIAAGQISNETLLLIIILVLVLIILL